MSTYTETEAYDHILTTFLQTWNDPTDGWDGIDGIDAEPYIKWENLKDTRDVDSNGDPRKDEPWLEIYTRPQDSDQVGIGAATGSGLYEAVGLLVVDIYVPVKTGLKFASELSTLCKRPFRGKRGYGAGSGITFPRVRSQRRGVERDRWFVTSVLVDYEYNEVV